MSEHGIERAWELMESLRFCMFATWNGRELRSRPMGAFVRRAEGAVYFFTDARAHKDEEIVRFPNVCLAFADTHGQKYLSVSGVAEMVSDRAMVKMLWSIPTKLWWESAEDPNLRLIKVTPQDGEFWDTPGNLVSSIKVAFALATGKHVRYGDREKVEF